MNNEDEACPGAWLLSDNDDEQEPRVIRLSPKAYADFVAMLSAPGIVVPEIVTIAKRRALWETYGA